MRSLLVVLALAACDSGSGVDTDKRIVDLSDAELDELCSYVVREQGTATATCEDDEGFEYDVEFPDVDECIDYFLSYSDDCPATVRQEEECAERLGENPCSEPAACDVAADC